jgi:RecG-like helicase
VSNQLSDTKKQAGLENWLWRRIRALISSNEELENKALTRQALEAGATPISRCAKRHWATIQGTVTMLTLNPKGERRWLEAEMTDGSGQLTLIWIGRRTIPGIQPGSKLRVQGLVADDHGRRVIYNPSYALLPE